MPILLPPTALYKDAGRCCCSGAGRYRLVASEQRTASIVVGTDIQTDGRTLVRRIDAYLSNTRPASIVEAWPQLKSVVLATAACLSVGLSQVEVLYPWSGWTDRASFWHRGFLWPIVRRALKKFLQKLTIFSVFSGFNTWLHVRGVTLRLAVAQEFFLLLLDMRFYAFYAGLLK